MADLTTMTNEQLLALHDSLSKASSEQNAAAATHTTAGSQSYREYDPARGMSLPAQLGAGFDESIVDLGMHAGNIVGAVSNPELAEYEHRMEPLGETPGGNFGEVAGQTATLAAGDLGLGYAAPRYLGPIGRMAFGGPIRAGVSSGAAQGAVLAEPGQRLKSAEVGAVAGGALPTGGRLFGMMLRGLPRTPAAQELIDRGVRLDPGAMDPEGPLNKTLENLRGLPIIGNRIEGAERTAWQDTQRGVMESAAAPGTTIPRNITDPAEMYRIAESSYGPLYDQARGFPVTPEIWNQGANVPLDQSFRMAAAQRGVGATRATRSRAGDFLDGQLQAFQDRANSRGGWDSGDLIELRSRINEEIRDAGIDQEGRSYRTLLRTARDHVTMALESQLPPDASAALRTANDQYPNLAIARDAMRRGADRPGGFTPNDLSMAVRQATDLGEYARGGGLMRDWSQPAREVFTERNPRTGMSLETLGPAGAAAYAAWHHPAVGVPVAGAGALALGTEAGRTLLRGQYPWQLAGQRLIGNLPAVPRTAAGIAGAGSRAALVRALQQRQAQLTGRTGTP